MTGDPCERCDVGTLHVYATKTLSSAIVRYLRCRLCGHRPEGNKLVLPLWQARRILGNRRKVASVVLTPLPGDLPQWDNPNMNDEPKHLLSYAEVAERLGVGVRELRAAVADGVFPVPVSIAGEPLFRWLEVVGWLEGGCVPQWGRIQDKLRHFDRCFVRANELGISYEHPYGDPLKGE